MTDELVQPEPPPPIAAAFPPPPPPPPVAAAPGTNGFAIASLVCSLATLMFCGIGSILGIVFGHVARRQIKRTGEGGAGLASAGLIIGYLGLAAIAVFVTVMIVASAVFRPDFNVDAARRLDRRIVAIAAATGTSPREPAAIDRALRSDFDFEPVELGATGIPAVGASRREFEGVGWQLQIHEPGDGPVCLTVPSTTRVRHSDVRDGRCRIGLLRGSSTGA